MQMMRKLFFAELHQAVRNEFEGILREPLPQRWVDLIKELETEYERRELASRDGSLGMHRAKDKRS